MRFIIGTVVWGFVFLPLAIAQDEVGECGFDNTFVTSASAAPGSKNLASEAQSSASASLSHSQPVASAGSSAPASSRTSIAGSSSALSVSSSKSIPTSRLSSTSSTSAARTSSASSNSAIKSTLMTSVLPSSSTSAANTPSALSITSVNSNPMSSAVSSSSTSLASASSAPSIYSVSNFRTSIGSSSSSTSAASTPSATSIFHPLWDCPRGIGYDPTPGILAIGYPARGQNVPVSQPFNITWADTSDITNVAIVLCHGPPTDCVSIDCIIPSVQNTGSYAWTPRSTLEAQEGQGYGIKIIAIGGSHEGEFQFSPQFGISNSSTQSSHAR